MLLGCTLPASPLGPLLSPIGALSSSMKGALQATRVYALSKGVRMLPACTLPASPPDPLLSSNVARSASNKGVRILQGCTLPACTACSTVCIQPLSVKLRRCNHSCCSVCIASLQRLRVRLGFTCLHSWCSASQACSVYASHWSLHAFEVLCIAGAKSLNAHLERNALQATDFECCLLGAHTFSFDVCTAGCLRAV
eukprot:317502-Pelagomonas_calceolata.AAC.3